MRVFKPSPSQRTFLTNERFHYRLYNSKQKFYKNREDYSELKNRKYDDLLHEFYVPQFLNGKIVQYGTRG